MSERRFTYAKSHRLAGKLSFAAVYDAGVRESRGPLSIFAAPNGIDHPRLGLSVSRRVGSAPRRNAIKRKLREAFRLMQHDFPTGYDWVIVVRPHEPLLLADYQRILSALLVKLHGAVDEQIHMKWLLVHLVLLYRVTLGPLLGGQCRFQPTCSQYAIDAVNKYGSIRGGWRAVKRICRCHPWGGNGYDPA